MAPTSLPSLPSVNDSLEQLPASTYTPIEVELLDRRQIDAWLDSISERLEGLKRAHAILYPQSSIFALPSEGGA